VLYSIQISSLKVKYLYVKDISNIYHINWRFFGIELFDPAIYSGDLKELNIIFCIVMAVVLIPLGLIIFKKSVENNSVTLRIPLLVKLMLVMGFLFVFAIIIFRLLL